MNRCPLNRNKLMLNVGEQYIHPKVKAVTIKSGNMAVVNDNVEGFAPSNVKSCGTMCSLSKRKYIVPNNQRVPPYTPITMPVKKFVPMNQGSKNKKGLTLDSYYQPLNINVKETADRIHSVPSERHGYYLDMSKKPVGNRPVYNRHDNANMIPNTLKVNTQNNVDKKFNCSQPVWNRKCK